MYIYKYIYIHNTYIYINNNAYIHNTYKYINTYIYRYNYIYKILDFIFYLRTAENKMKYNNYARSVISQQKIQFKINNSTIKEMFRNKIIYQI